MSYNIDSVSYISGELSVDRKRAFDYEDEHGDELPEDCFIYNVSGKFPENVALKYITWQGEHSGDLDEFKRALAITTGRAELLVCWEGGDRYTGLEVVDGVVTEKKVKFVLG